MYTYILWSDVKRCLRYYSTELLQVLMNLAEAKENLNTEIANPLESKTKVHYCVSIYYLPVKDQKNVIISFISLFFLYLTIVITFSIIFSTSQLLLLFFISELLLHFISLNCYYIYTTIVSLNPTIIIKFSISQLLLHFQLFISISGLLFNFLSFLFSIYLLTLKIEREVT